MKYWFESHFSALGNSALPQSVKPVDPELELRNEFGDILDESEISDAVQLIWEAGNYWVEKAKGPEPLVNASEDRAYVTPIFPEGIRLTALSSQSSEIQRHVVLYWFIRNYEPAQGTFFGFGSASGPEAFDGSARFDGSAPFGSPQNPNVRVAGFDQAPFFNGGTADRFLMAEFDSGVSVAVLSEVISALPGMWMPRKAQQLTSTDASAQEQKAALVGLLDGFDEGVRKLPTMSPGRWDNNPPEAERLPDESDALKPEERDDVLRATADMRLALVSENYSRAWALWEGLQPILAKVTTYMGKKLDSVLDAAIKVVGGALGAAALVSLLIWIGVLDKADAITALLKALHLS